MKRFALIPLITLFALSVLLAAALSIATTAPAQADPALQHEYDRVVVRAYFDDPALVRRLGSWTEPWEVDYGKGFLVVDVTADEYRRLQDMGFRVEIDEALTERVNRPRPTAPDQVSGIPGYACYRTVEETFDTAATLSADYPHLATWIDVGDSWEKGNGFGGYDMNVLRLTNANTPGPKPKIFIMSSVHAREYTPAELNTRLAEYLVYNYGVDADVTWLLDYHEFHLMLQANPDGRKQAETGLLWRKNTNQNYCGPTSNNRGADLNRNYSFYWNGCSPSLGCSSGYQCDSTYRGPSPASEPETQAVQNYVRSIFPDQRQDPINAAAPITATGVFMDLHSYSELVLWSWGFTYDPAPNDTALQTLGRKLAYFNGYEPMSASGLYPTDGTTDDFAYGELGLAAYTFELGTSFFQDCGAFENEILPDNLPALLYLGKTARAPYLLPAGPDPLDVAVAPNVAEPGDLITLTATLDDTRFNNQNGAEPTQPIAAAAYYLDTPPWITETTPISAPLTAVDGSFDTVVEEVQGVIDTTGLATGRHTFYVRGRDAAGNWGVVGAAFLYVVEPGVSPLIGGEVIAADTGQPLSATIRAGANFQTETDSNGHYAFRVISGTYDLVAAPGSSDYGGATVADVVAHDHQTVQQDFLLYPFGDIFTDDVEAGNIGWMADDAWAIVTEKSHSPSHSWTDSPGGNYGNNRNSSLTSPVLDLSGYSDLILNFWQICDTEAGYDFCNVEVSGDAGSTWMTVASYDGEGPSWQEATVSVSQLDNQPQARIRFRLSSDAYVTDDGWYVDDIVLRGAGPGVVDNMAPIADFDSSAPDALGETTIFTNTSAGADLSVWWDFGDGSPVVTTTDAAHTYTATGAYTVTLTVSNTVGMDQHQEQVQVMVPPAASFTATTPVYVGETAVFTNTSTGSALSFHWNMGDGSPIGNGLHYTHVYTAAGAYTVTLTALNPVGTDAATTAVTVLAPPAADVELYLPLITRPN